MSDRHDIIALPNQALRQRSKRIGVISAQIRSLVSDMQSATLDWEDHRKHEVGVALAAIQIDQAYRLVIVRKDLQNKRDRNFLVLINPEITKHEGKLVEDYEGCLSVPDIYGHVPRYERVRVRALDINGKPIRLKAEGFQARVLQHEIDHTNGLLFIDHIKNKKDAFFRLNDEGKLEPLDYEKDIKANRILW